MARLLMMLVAAAMPAAAWAQATVALLPGWAEAPGERVAGLSIALSPGWKTYWRSPGEGGLAPAFDWSGSTNLASVTVEWPAPTVIETYGMQSVVYDADVVLPLRLVAADPAQPVSVALSLSFGVCADICVPAQADVAMVLDPGADAGDAALIRAHRARVPVAHEAAGLGAVACSVRGAGPDRVFEARLGGQGLPRGTPTMLVEGPPTAWFGPVDVRRDGAALLASGPVQVWGESTWIGRDALRLTLLWPDRAFDVQGCSAAAP